MEEVSRLRALLENISSYLRISSTDKLYSNPAHKYYTRGEEIAKLLLPLLDKFVISDASPNELLNNGFEELSQYVDELREQFESWKPLSSRIFYVLRIESLASKLRESILEVFQLLKHLPADLVSPSFEDCIELVKSVEREEVSYTIDLALIDQRKGVQLTPEVLVKIAESVGLRSNQDILIEGVLLASLKEDAEIVKNNTKTEFIEGLISLITQMHEYLANIKQSQLPPDFCCPLSLELMTDPVIVASGQTYERAFIEKWFDMGLMVCPKTRQALSQTTLTPNFTLKAFIANWCESENVNPPDPMELIHSTQPFPLLVGTGCSGSLPLPVMDDDTLKCSHIESVDATKCEELRQGLTRSASAPGNVSEVASKGKRSTNGAAADTSLRHIRDPWIILPTIKKTGSSSNMEAEVKKLIQELESSSLDAQREATSRIRILTRNSIDHRPVFVRCGAINSLVNKLYSKDERIQADAAACLLNFTLNNNYVITSSEATEPFIHVLKTGNLEAKANVATTLVSLSGTEENKTKIAKAGAIEPLVELMGHGSQAAKKDAATALFNLTQRYREKDKVIRAGGIRYLVKMMDPAGGLVERAVVVLANLATVPAARMAIRDEGGIPLLVEVVELGSPRGKENAAAALCLVCMDSSRLCNAVIREGAIPPLVALTRSGTARAKEKAKTLLKYFEAVKQENKENQTRS